MNDSDVRQVSNLSSETPNRSVSEGQAEQPPAGGESLPTDQQTTLDDGSRSVPATDSGQVENLSYEQALDRIRTHSDLTPAMRERLAELVQRQPPAEGSPQLPLDDVLAILAETVPSQLRLAAGELPLAPHPEGEAFFSGDPASDAERQAAAVATEQLALSGLLRKG
ncbi:MAG TPA: hypothetical protein VFB96_11295 [Pirellulaceae bacterium]|nr:hypothetical protein [Pirellulaceae bacterium]